MATDTRTRGRPGSPRPRRVRTTDDGRRLWSAGHALVVSALALAAGLLLNAPGIHKSAYNKPQGWQRDVALAVTGPLDAVSRALLLDRPRRGVQALVGRSGEDEIDTAIELPPPAAPAEARAAPPTSKPARKHARVAFTPARKLRLWIAGDSLVLTPGWSIVRAAGESPVITPVGGVEGRVATGLERPDVFNWFQNVRERVRELRPRAVVLSFGANDDHGYMTGLPRGVTVDGFGSPGWRREYARRAGGLMDTVSRAGAFVVWIGLPITRNPKQAVRFDTINAVVEREARKRPGRVAFVDTYGLFASDAGGFTEYLPDASGRVRKVRAGDGVHFEGAGGDMIAREVLRRLNEAYDLTSWRRSKAAA